LSLQAVKMKERIKEVFNESIQVKQKTIESSLEAIEKAVRIIIESLSNGGTVFVFGNGGSAADAQHIAAELIGKYYRLRKPLRALALTTNTSNLTAWSNDVGFESVFARQIAALGKPGDIAWGISTSGNSPNVLQALAQAAEMGLKTIGLTGEGGGTMKDMCDVLMAASSNDTPRIQEAHETIYHIICELVEKELT